MLHIDDDGRERPYQSGDDTGWHTILQEIDVRQVKLPHLILLRCSGIQQRPCSLALASSEEKQSKDLRGLIREARDWHTHSSGTNEPSNENE